MEIDSFLHKIQGVLKNEERNLGSLTSLSEDNKKQVSRVVLAVEGTFLSEKDLSEKKREKLLILLFLNVYSEFYGDLKKNRKLAHLVGFFPKISRHLFNSIAITLHLYKCAHIWVGKLPSPLCYQLVLYCFDIIHSLDLFINVDFVKNLLIELFKKIVTLNNEDGYGSHLKDLFQRLLLDCEAETKEHLRKMCSWDLSMLHHYAGNIMASCLLLLEECTNIYCKMENLTPVDDIGFLNLQVDLDIKLSPVPELSTQQCYECIVAKCQKNISSVTVDLWLFWVEIDVSDVPDSEDTLQRLVGERAYTCREALIKATKDFGITSRDVSELVTKLHGFAMKPRTEEDKAKTVHLDNILKNIQDPTKDNVNWMRFLFNSPSFSIEYKVLDVIKSNLCLLDGYDAVELTKLLFTHIKNNEDCVYHKNLILEVVKSVDFETQTDISRVFLDKFGILPVLKRQDFVAILIRSFNKIIKEEKEEKKLLPEFFSLAMQDPELTVKAAVEKGVGILARRHLMANLLRRLKVFCDFTPPETGRPLLHAVLLGILNELQAGQEIKCNNFPLFVQELAVRRILKGSEFVENCILKNLHIHLKENNTLSLSVSLATLSVMSESGHWRPKMPATSVLVSALQVCRWSPTNFTMTKAHSCQVLQQVIKECVSVSLESGFEESAMEKLVALVRSEVRPLDRYHLSRMLSEEPEPEDPALLLMYRAHFGIGLWSVLQVTKEDRSQLVYSLCFVLPLLTKFEWKELFCVVTPNKEEFLCLFQIVCDSLLLCVDSAKLKSDPSVLNCLEYAIINLAEVVKGESSGWDKSEKVLHINILAGLCLLISRLPMPLQDTLGGSVIKVLKQLLPGSRQNPLTLVEMNQVTAAINLFQPSLTRQGLSIEFVGMMYSMYEPRTSGQP